ncbi:MAG: hypothetical protein ACE5H4_00795 [Candidatus Thorarchaeota archaeon]
MFFRIRMTQSELQYRTQLQLEAFHSDYKLVVPYTGVSPRERQIEIVSKLEIEGETLRRYSLTALGLSGAVILMLPLFLLPGLLLFVLPVEIALLGRTYDTFTGKEASGVSLREISQEADPLHSDHTSKPTVRRSGYNLLTA